MRNFEPRHTVHVPRPVLSELDRVNLAIDVINRAPQLQGTSAHMGEELEKELIKHCQYIRVHGEDMAAITNWQWSRAPGHTNRSANMPSEEAV